MRKNIILLLTAMFLMVASFTCFSYLGLKKESNKKKLVFWSIQLKPVYEKQIKDVIKTFEANNPEYSVVWVDIPIQEAQKRTLASVLSSTPPDLINLNPDFSVMLAQKNALYTFNEDAYSEFHPGLVERLKYKDKVYALPFYVTSPVTVYNKEIYQKCIGGDFIKTYDELYKISEKIKKCSNSTSFVSSINENDVFAKILNKYDVKNFSDDNEIKNAKNVYSMFNQMYKKNFIPKDILAINHREAVEKYMADKTVVMVAGSNFIKMIKQNAPAVYSKSEIASQLTGKNGKYDISLMNLVIPKKSANIEAAINFAMLLTNKENQLELSRVTNVLPANKYALQDERFKKCSEDLIEKSRCISVLQLNNLNNVSFGDLNKNTINENINKTLEEILLTSDNSTDYIDKKVNELSNQIKALQENK